MARFFALLALITFFSYPALAQRNDLMIVGYYDARLGDGYGLAIHNPTDLPLDLSNYWIKTQNNGGSPQAVTFSAQLSGTLNPGQTKIIGNDDYCSSCSFDINLGQATGVNGNDAIAITRGNSFNFVDMVNLWGTDVSPRVDGQSNALAERTIIRGPDNFTRYTSTNGSGPNSWPSASNVNVTGWTYVGVGTRNCLTRSFSLVSVPRPALPPTLSACVGTPITINTGILISTPVRWSNGSTAPSITVTQPGLYFVASQPGSCEIRDSVVVTFFSAPSLNLKDTTLCNNEPLILDAGPVGPYLWSTGESTRSVVVSEGKYWVRAGSGSCQSSDTSVVTKLSLPELGLPEKEVVCRGMVTSYTAPRGFKDYKWSTGDTGRSFYKFNFQGKVFLDASNGKCTRRDTITFVADECPFSFPNVLTPDNNGMNDRWSVITQWEFISSEVSVYNRWGQLLINNSNQTAYGPGFDASELSAGTYYVRFSGIIPTGKTITHEDWVEIIR